MDEQFLVDIRKALEDGLACEDWNCVIEAIDIIREAQNDYEDDDDETYEF